MQNSTENKFQESLLANVTKFAFTMSRMIDVVMGSRCTIEDVTVGEEGLIATEKCVVSILFTGTVYGEYILCIDESVAMALLGMDAKTENVRADIEDSFRELLNVVVGETVVNLHDSSSKLTVTPPRVTFGSVRYPNFKTGRAVLLCDKGQIDCYLYIDRMKLDIASSYGQALTSLQTAHEALQNAMGKLQAQQVYLVQSEKMAALGTMAAGVAHEINTPLATVSMISEQLKEIVTAQSINVEDVIEMLDTIEETIVRISKITNGMRAFAYKSKNGEHSMTTFEEIVGHALLSCKKELSDSGIELKMVESNIPIAFECRSVEITHVLLSLIANAMDAVASLPEKWIKIEAYSIDNVVEIRVTDSGKGISEVVRDKVFDPFFTTKDVGKGVGLGLSVSKGIVSGHNGTIAIDSTTAHTCFVVRLPRTHKKQAA